MTLSVTPPVLDTAVFLPFDRMTSDVEQAESKAIVTFGDYNNPAVNKKARSYVYDLRKVRTSIDRTRKAQNDEAQSYIRNVNNYAKELSARVTALIEPHEVILKGIEEAEKERVDNHESDLETIIEMRRVPYGAGSAQIQSYLDTLAEIDPTTFEEFTPKADAEIVISREALEQALQAALDHEAAEAERERLRQEAAEAKRIARETEIAEKAAAEAKKEAEEAAAEALDAERRKTEAAEKRASAAEKQALLPEIKRKATTPPPEAVPSPACGPPSREKRQKLIEIIEDAVLDNTSKGFATMLAMGEVHPALTIDWSKVVV